MNDWIQTLREHDYPRLMAIQLAPLALRSPLLVLTVFAVELSLIASRVREPLAGHIRLAWWRDEVQKLANQSDGASHPLLLALHPLLQTKTALVPLLLRMIEGRAMDLDPAMLLEEAAWQDYWGATAGALHQAWAVVLDESAAQMHAHSIVRAACVYAQTEHVYTAGGANIPEWMRRLEREHEPIVLPATLKPLRALERFVTYRQRMLKKARNHPHHRKPEKLGLLWRVIQMKLFLY